MKKDKNIKKDTKKVEDLKNSYDKTVKQQLAKIIFKGKSK